MKITKFGHSCLLVEEGDAKILIDPGRYCFIEGKMQPEEFPEFNALLITHEHPDHCDVESLPRILGKREVPIFTHASVADILRQHRFTSHVLAPGEETVQNGVSIQAIRAPHGLLPEVIKTPENVGFLIDGRLLHPGDSLEFVLSEVEFLALPIVAPWLTLRMALETAARVRPKSVIPIHDAIMKEWFRPPYELLERFGKEIGFQVRELGFRESVIL